MNRVEEALRELGQPALSTYERSKLTLIEARDLVNALGQGLAPVTDILRALVEVSDAMGRAQLFLELRRLLREVEDLKKLVSGAERNITEPVCARLINDELVPCRLPTATLSPGVSTYYKVEDVLRFYDEMHERGLSLNDVVKTMTSVTRMRELCDPLMEAGEPLPPGVKVHLEPKVRVLEKV